MFFYKLKNFIKDGLVDWKGLDINKNIPGSQVYDLKINNICITINMEEKKSNEELIKITKEEYNKIRDEINKESINKDQESKENLQEEIKTLKQQLAQCQQSITELTALASTMLAPKE